MIVEGQLHGGITQGVGQALLEHCVYDTETGQILSGSFQDYACRGPTTCRPSRCSTHSMPSTDTPMGVKGCGEVGTIGSPAAIMNAVVDALARPWRHAHRHAGQPVARVGGDRGGAALKWQGRQRFACRRPLARVRERRSVPRSRQSRP